MSQPTHYSTYAPDTFRRYLDFSMSVSKGSIEESLLHLVDVRVSQINGCAFCVDMHVKQSKIAGERELRLYHVAIWRESPLFTAREKAALAWAEVLTTLPPHGITAAERAEARANFSEKELVDLTFAITAINGWNRISIGFQSEPGSQDQAYGLTKAGLQ